MRQSNANLRERVVKAETAVWEMIQKRFQPFGYDRLVRFFLAGVILAMIPGCSGEEPATYPVSGTVHLDGKPLAGVSVMLQPDVGSFGYGVTDENGAFVVSTFEVGDGAIPGKHGIIVTRQSSAMFVGDTSGETTPTESDAVIEIPQKYSKVQTSGLTVEVDSRLKPLFLELTSH